MSQEPVLKEAGKSTGLAIAWVKARNKAKACASVKAGRVVRLRRREVHPKVAVAGLHDGGGGILGQTIFDRFNTPALPGAQIANLHLDREDRLWISTEAGIVVKKGNEWSPVFGAEQGWTGDFVRTFAERDGKLFVSSFNGKFSNSTNTDSTNCPTRPAKQAAVTSRMWIGKARFGPRNIASPALGMARNGAKLSRPARS
jgi:hypothetical protein